MVKELEARVHQLTVEAESSNLQQQKLSEENANLEKAYQTVSTELQEVKARYLMQGFYLTMKTYDSANFLKGL